MRSFNLQAIFTVIILVVQTSFGSSEVAASIYGYDIKVFKASGDDALTEEERLKSDSYSIKRELANYIIAHALEQFNIGQPSQEKIGEFNTSRDDEVKSYVLQLQKSYTKELVEKKKKLHEALIFLIETWQKDKEEGEKLYKLEFANRYKFTAEWWEKVKKNYPTAKELAHLKDFANNIKYDPEYIRKMVDQYEKNYHDVNVRPFIYAERVKMLKRFLRNNRTIQMNYSFQDWVDDEIRSKATIAPKYIKYVFPQTDKDIAASIYGKNIPVKKFEGDGKATEYQLLRSEASLVKHKLHDFVVENGFHKYDIGYPGDDKMGELKEIALKKATERDKKSDHYYKKSMIRERKQLLMLSRLMETWQKDKEEGERLYKSEYADIYTVEKWEGYKKFFTTPDSLKGIKAAMNNIKYNPEAKKKRIKNNQEQHLQKLIYKERVKMLERALENEYIIKSDYSFNDWINDEISSNATVAPQYLEFIFPAYPHKRSAK